MQAVGDDVGTPSRCVRPQSCANKGIQKTGGAATRNPEVPSRQKIHSSHRKSHRVLAFARVPVIALPDPCARLRFRSPRTVADAQKLGFSSFTHRVAYPLAARRFLEL